MKHFLDIIFIRPVFRKRKIKTFDDIEEHLADIFNVITGLLIWAIIIICCIELIIY